MLPDVSGANTGPPASLSPGRATRPGAPAFPLGPRDSSPASNSPQHPATPQAPLRRADTPVRPFELPQTPYLTPRPMDYAPAFPRACQAPAWHRNLQPVPPHPHPGLARLTRVLRPHPRACGPLLRSVQIASVPRRSSSRASNSPQHPATPQAPLRRADTPVRPFELPQTPYLTPRPHGLRLRLSSLLSYLIALISSLIPPLRRADTPLHPFELPQTPYLTPCPHGPRFRLSSLLSYLLSLLSYLIALISSLLSPLSPPPFPAFPPRPPRLRGSITAPDLHHPTCSSPAYQVRIHHPPAC